MADATAEGGHAVTTDDVPAVELVGITKAYPGVVANDGIDLVVASGEVHCLLGENGAGKSTLMSILAGMVRPDRGIVRVDGRPVDVASPRRALDLGIGMVYQHVTLVPTLTVLENLMLGGREPGTGVRGRLRALTLDSRTARERLGELCDMLGVEVDADVRVGSLSLGQQQQVEIAKALWRGSRVLILDEPTSMLTPAGVAELANVLVRLKSHGLAIVLITHKLHEAISMGDRISVLRQGRLVGAIDPEELRSRTHDELQERIVAIMFGADTRAPVVAELADRIEGHRAARALPDEPVLEFDGATVAAQSGEVGMRDVTFAVRPGEIFGIAGVDGNGQRELAEAVAGQRPLVGGDVRFAGLSIAGLRVSQRQKLGLRYVTDDRLGEGTVSALPVALNLVLKRIGQAPFWRRGRIRPSAIAEVARRLISDFDIRTPGPDTRVGALSGGNVQKVVLARELSFEPRLIVYSKPTYGLDIRTTQAIRARIREQAEQGITSMVISTDLEELLDLCDRIAVLSRGRVAGVVENGPDAERAIGALMVGGRAEAA
jgi:simple sugar transport system ATP-binding protein